MQNAREVAAALREIAALLEFSKAPTFKVRAYRRAAEVVSTVGELAPMVEQGRLPELPGIGPALSHQIDELWNTGSSEYLKRLAREQPEGATELMQVEGVTPRRLRALHDALGIRSVADLRAACGAGRVRGVKGFGQKTEASLLAACDRWFRRGEEVPLPVLLSRALERAGALETRILEVSPATLAGAVRRGEETVRELEWVVVGNSERAMSHLSLLPAVLRVEPEARVAHLSEGLDLKLHPATSAAFGNSLVLATGNDAHVERIRTRAASLGFQLAGWDKVAPRTLPVRAFASERELYEALGCSFVPPELRTGTGELERAATENFGDLVAATDVVGMVHCHTNYSDGKCSIAEMAQAAHALGMKYITITDHSPSAHYAGGVSLESLERQWDEIAEAQEHVPIRILRGTESDILADGSLDYPDAVLERFDVVIASIHARHRMDPPAMTRRLLRALSLPLFKIWGHPLGRILNHRDPIECDVPALLDGLAASRGAIELNADPHRLDLPPAWIAAARERGIPFVISVDAHSTRGLGALGYGVTMARRGGLRRADVLNTLPSEDFAARVRPF